MKASSFGKRALSLHRKNQIGLLYEDKNNEGGCFNQVSISQEEEGGLPRPIREVHEGSL